MNCQNSSPETLPPAPKRRGLMQTLYDWMMANAAGRHAWTTLFIVSFAESSFFPIIPDVMLVPMILADRKHAFRLAAWCTLASVLGGMLGYAIGAFLYDSAGKWLISLYGYGDKVNEFRIFYAEWGAWVILVKGVSPIPYKVVTILSGFAAYNFSMFVLLSIITRGARFTLWAILLYIYGEPIREFIEKRLELVLFATFMTIMIGFLLATYLF
ncbi:MAG: DedA family protein [Gammaproteobacteria bacterium]|nr:DedA family protein [Gammaproteobacteria bacterium]